MTDTQTEPTKHSYETTTPSGTDVEITVKFGTAYVNVPDADVFARVGEGRITTKRGTTVLDLGLHSGEHIYVPIDDDLADDLRDAMGDTEDESAADFRDGGDDGKWYEGYANSDGEEYDFDDGHVAADNE